MTLIGFAKLFQVESHTHANLHEAEYSDETSIFKIILRFTLSTQVKINPKMNILDRPFNRDELKFQAYAIIS